MITFFRDLNITDAQKTDLIALKDEVDNQTKALEQPIQDLRDQMEQTFLAATVDNATAQTQIDQMLGYQTQIANIMMQAGLQATSQILTADQRALVLDMITKIQQCEESQHSWKMLAKPSYFSLLVPDSAF
jgi:Spy/CpxP family protein refolding chaperone